MAEYLAEDGWEDVEYSATDGWEDVSKTDTTTDDWADVDTYQQEEAQDTYKQSNVLGELFREAKNEVTTLANKTKPEDSNEMIRNMDAQYTGNSAKVTEFNQYVNNFTPEEKDLFENKSMGKPYLEQLEIAKKMTLDNSRTKAEDYVGNLKNIPENLKRGVVQNIKASPQIAGNVAQLSGTALDRPPGIEVLTKPDPLRAPFKVASQYISKKTGFGEWLKRKGKALAEKNKLYMQTRKDLEPTDDSTISRFAHATGSGVVSIGEASAIALITKNPGLAGSVFGLQAAGDTFVNAKEQGLDDDTAIKYATVDGVLEAGLESLSLSKILKPGSGRSLRAVASSVLTEGSTEGMQEIKGNIIRKYKLGMDVEVMDNVLMSIGVGSLLGGGTAVVIPENVKQRLDEEGVPPEAQKEILDLSKDITQKLKDKGYTEAETKELNAYVKDEIIKPEEIEETLKEKPFEDVKPPEEGKPQQLPDRPEGEARAPKFQEAELSQEANKYGSAEEFIDSQRDFRDAHVAPSYDDRATDIKLEEGGDFSLDEVAQGKHNQPDDYFDPTVGARYYGYDTIQGKQSSVAIGNIIRARKNGIKDRTITAYRAIPINIESKELTEGDWITFSEQYAIDHGESRFGENEYKIVKQELAPSEAWWDGNDINEWGYGTKPLDKLSRKELTDIYNKAQPKFQEKEAKPAKQIFQIAEARKIVKSYGVDIDNVKGTYDITMPNGKKASGKYADDLIYIAHLARETTGAHESFHYLTDKFIDDTLYQKALKETGKTGTEADEYLAEEFGKYRNNRQTVTGQIRKLFDELMRALKRVFGGKKYANRLFNALEKGKGIGVPKMLSKVKYQELTPGQKKMAKDWIKIRLNKEMENMRNEVKDYKRGRVVKGKTVESEFPSWARELGLSNEAQALQALRRGNKNYAEALAQANKRLSEGYKDVQSGMEIPPSKEWQTIAKGAKEAIGAKEYKAITEYVPTKEEQVSRETKELKREVKKVTKEKEVLKGKVEEGKYTEALKQKKIAELQKEAKKKGDEKAIRADEKKKVLNALREKQGDIQEFKKEAIAYAKKLPLHERGKLLARIKNLKTLLDRAKLISYIDKLGSQAKMRQLKLDIKKELKKTKTKKQAGKVVGKYTPEIQAVLNSMREATVLTQEQAQNKIAENMEKYTDQMPPAEIALQNKILSIYGGLDEQTVENLEKGLSFIKDIKNKGKLANELKKLVRGTAIAEDLEDAIKVVTGGKNLPDDYSFRSIKEYEPKTIKEKLSVTMRGLGKTMVGYKDILDMLSSLDKTSKPGESALNKFGDVLDEKNAEKKGVKDNMQKVSDMAFKTLGIKNDSDLMDRFNKDMEEKNLGRVKLKTGQEINLTINKAEARKLYMEFKDDTLTESFDNMGYTDEIRQKISDFLTPQDKAFANAQMEFYQNYYDSINEVYSDIYGVDLPKNQFYSPIKREGIGKEEVLGNEFLQEIAFQRSVAPGSTKARVLNTKKIQRQNDVAVIEQHITEMEHFKAWAEKIRDLKSVYGNSQFMDAVAINHDKKLLSILNGFIDSFTANGTEYKNMLGIINKLRVNVAKSVLPLKASIGIKQLTSAPAYADAIPLQHWIKGSLKFWKNPIKNTKMMYDSSTLLQTRGKHQERDLALVAKSQKYEKFRKGKNLTEKAMLNVQLGDQGAIVAGGFAVIDYYENVKGLSHKEAVRKFESVTESTQQSADISEQSVFQRGPLKLFTLFKSSPNQYLRKEFQAARGLLTQRGDVSQHAKTMVIFHLVLPTLFQWVSNGFRWDDDEQKRAAIFGTLNGLFILGDGLDYVLRKLLRMRTWGMSTTVLSIFKDLGDLIGIATKKNPKPEDELRMARKAADVVGKMGGLPVKQLIDMGHGAAKISEGEVEEGLKQLAGYSPYIAEQSSPKKLTTREKRMEKFKERKKKLADKRKARRAKLKR